MNNARMTSVGGSDEYESAGQGCSPLSILESSAIYCRNLEHLELNNVRVGFEQKDLRTAIFGENVGSMELDSFHAQNGPSSAPEIEGTNIGRLIMDGKDVSSAAVAPPTAIETPEGAFEQVTRSRLQFACRTQVAMDWLTFPCESEAPAFRERFGCKLDRRRPYRS